jgi:hypothetical protein
MQKAAKEVMLVGVARVVKAVGTGLERAAGNWAEGRMAEAG